LVSQVFRAKPRDEEGYIVVKIMRDLKRDPQTGRPSPEYKWQIFKKEWEACRRLRHRNIVAFERVIWLTTSSTVRPSPLCAIALQLFFSRRQTNSQHFTFSDVSDKCSLHAFVCEHSLCLVPLQTPSYALYSVSRNVFRWVGRFDRLTLFYVTALRRRG
jgi:hypothetical protein